MRSKGEPHSRRFTRYAAFTQLSGAHPFKRAVPDGFVDYEARRSHGSSVVYFNFALAREMGLIPSDHPDRLTAGLRRAILDSFSLTIINEYDLKTGTPIPAHDRLPGRYMATRYLQLQHPGRQGRTSGDGRSVWNGTVDAGCGVWDVSSCGTGVTRLCPATAWSHRYYKTGSRIASYGCGRAWLEDGLAAALMSEVFHRQGVPTERTLAVLELESGYAITVRAGRNLLRPSHFFVHARQGNLTNLRGVADLCYERQVRNGEIRAVPGRRRYAALAEAVTRRFAQASALFESEYIFVWLDWDGDNVLTDGGIIDYGSVRQFGLFHREYRYDDGPRWSTTITEQRLKARLIVQNFAQICDWLRTGVKRPLAYYRRSALLALFDREFALERRRRLLLGVGFDRAQTDLLMRRHPRLVERFQRAHAYFERARASRGPVKVEDGITWNAIFSVRDILRELPLRFSRDPRPLAPRAFLDLAASSYASRRDRLVTASRARQAAEFQRRYLQLVDRVAQASRGSRQELLIAVAERSAIINRRARVTGDSANYAARCLTRARRRLSPEAMYQVIQSVVQQQTTAVAAVAAAGLPGGDAKRLFDRLLGLVEYCRHGL